MLYTRENNVNCQLSCSCKVFLQWKTVANAGFIDWHVCHSFTDFAVAHFKSSLSLNIIHIFLCYMTLYVFFCHMPSYIFFSCLVYMCLHVIQLIDMYCSFLTCILLSIPVSQSKCKMCGSSCDSIQLTGQVNMWCAARCK